MKKIIGLALATLFIAGIFANVAMADERVQLNGEMRVRAWSISVGDEDDENYFDQRLRVGTTINVADGVKVISRMDFAEDTWGSDNWDGSRYDETSELQVDRAYLQVDKGIIGVTAGQAFFGLGNTIAYDNNATGIKLDIKTPVLITLGYTKESEGGDTTDEEDDLTEDTDTYFVNLGYAADNFSVNGFYAAAKDGNDDGWEPNVVGLQGTFSTGMLSFNAELNVFGGEMSGVDVFGTQFWGNVEAAVMDNLKVGLDLVYSDGNDFEDDELKITALNNWGDWYITDRGPFNTDICPLDDSDALDPVSPFIGTIIDDIIAAAGIDTGSAEVGGQQGSIGAGVYAVFTPVEGVDLYGQVMYLQPEEDWDDDGVWDDVLILNLGAEWMFAPNTTIAAQYSRSDWSSDYDEMDDTADVFVARLAVNF